MVTGNRGVVVPVIVSGNVEEDGISCTVRGGSFSRVGRVRVSAVDRPAWSLITNSGLVSVVVVVNLPFNTSVFESGWSRTIVRGKASAERPWISENPSFVIIDVVDRDGGAESTPKIRVFWVVPPVVEA